MQPTASTLLPLTGSLTLALLVVPFIFGLLCLLLPRQAKKIALASTLTSAALTAYVIYLFNINYRKGFLANMQGIVEVPWIKNLGVEFFIGLDGISLLMVILTNFLLPLIVLSTWKREFSPSGLFYFLMLAMQGALVGVFVSLDGFLYYIFWELALIPIYFIILLWGGENKVRITFKFFIYTLSGSLVMLAAIIYLYLIAGNSFHIGSWYNLQLDPITQRWIFWAFFLAYAIKIPLLPFHSWQPDTYTTAPNSGAMLLSGIMLKMGIYSIIRWILPITPHAVVAYSDVAIIMCIAGVLYGSWVAIGQRDYKRMVAWSSIAHVGLITSGIFTLSQVGIQATLIQMIAHGVNVVGLFFVCEILSTRLNTNHMDDLGGIRQLAPVFASVFMVITFASAALPLTNSFIGEFMLLNALYETDYYYAGLAGLTIIMGAVYMLRGYQSVMLGDKVQTQGFVDLTMQERLVFFPIVGLILFFGIYPQFIFNLTDESVKFLLHQIDEHLMAY
ncbi:MAG: NuoM family protein [Bacteroidia bacterium]|jgi:NADH-quinone oxidoreductase subunit M